MRKALYILSALKDADIHWLVTIGCRQDLGPQEVLIRSGHSINALYITLEGELIVTLGDHKPREVARLSVGEVIGEISFLDSRPPLTSVSAVGHASVLAIPRPALSAKLETDHEFAARFYRAVGTFLAQRLRETTATLGYGTGVPTAEQRDEVDVLPEDVMEGVSLGGARFTWILDQLSRAR